MRKDFTDPRHWHVYYDVLPTLDELSRRGWIPLVLSNHVPELAEISAGLGLGRRIYRTFNSAETGYEKPHPESYRTVLKTLEDAESVWMIGDNVPDVIGAEAAGVPAVLVRDLHPNAARYSEDLLGVPALVEEDS